MFEFLKKLACKDVNIYKTIVESIRSSLDIEETKKTIIDIIGKALNADRCFIMEYDTERDRFKESQEEYLSSPDLPSYIGVDLNEHIPHFVSEFKKGKRLIFNVQKAQFDDNDIDLNDGTFENEKEAIQKYKVHSAVVLPLIHDGEFLGDLVIHYVDKKHNAGKFERDLLNDVSNQISIAIHQANLYKIVQKNAKRESLIFNMTEKIRLSLNIDEVLPFICKEIVALFNVQRAVITSFVNLKDSKDFILRAECKSAQDISGYSNEAEFLEAVSYLTSYIYENKIIAFDRIEESDTTDAFKKTYSDLGVKSIIGISVRKGNDIWGTIVLSEYNNYRHWTDEDKKILTVVANQVYMAVNQAELYNAVQKKAQHEKLLRDIMLSFVQTLNMEELINNIVTQTGRLFMADRCFFIGYDEKKGSSLPVEQYAEYLSSPSIKSHVLKVPSKSETGVFRKEIRRQNVIYVSDIDKIELPEATRKMLVDELSVKSYLIAPIYYGETSYGSIVLHYVNEPKKFSEEELNILITIANQATIVIHQAKLYEKQLLLARREALLRDIIEKIRSSLDVEETLYFICEIVAKTFNVQRVSIAQHSILNNQTEIIFRKEYKENEDLLGISVMDNSSEFFNYAYSLFQQANSFAINNIQESDLPSFFIENYNRIGVKALIGASIKNSQNVWGVLVLSEYNEYRYWSEEDKVLLEAIANQVYIAINQAELYENQKNMAERERISRNIIEILRSSLDKTIIKQLFVKNIGKFFDADRVVFSEYDNENRVFLPIDKESEYLSSPSEKSMVGFDWSNSAFLFYIQPLLEKREIKIPGWSEYVKQNPTLDENFENFYKGAGIKSTYSFPVLHQTDIIGYFSIEFTKRTCELSDEDIGRIRSICTQSGIALYHAALYEKAQHCFQTQGVIASEIAGKIRKPANEILNKAIHMTQNEIDRLAQIDYLNTIINACNQLLELTKGLPDDY